MIFKKPSSLNFIKRDTVPINSLQSDGTIDFSHNLRNISNINLTINDCSQNMCQLKQFCLLTLFGISIVNFTLTILNTQNIAVNSTLMNQMNLTTAIITKDVFRISSHLSELNSWKYILNLMSSYHGLFCQVSELFASISVFITTKPMGLMSIYSICTHIILFNKQKAARFRHLLGCLFWGCNLYLQGQSLVEDNILCRVLCSTFILLLIMQILLTSQQEVKVYNLNISDTSPRSSKIRIHKRNLFSKNKINNPGLNNDDTKKTNCFNNFDQNNIFCSSENLFLGNKSENLFDDLIKISPKNTVEVNTKLIDSYCDSLKNLKLSTNPSFVLNKVNPHFRQKEYGIKQIPDIFVKNSVLLSPPRFQKLSQESWVAGGYWKHDQYEFVTSQFKSNQLLLKNLTPLSRSSSQSSGFSSQSGDHNSFIESTNSVKTSKSNSKFFLPQYDDRLSVRSEPAYHSNL